MGTEPLRGAVAHLCSYTGCATAPAHVEARRLVEAIKTESDAAHAMGKIRATIPGLFAEEHAAQALARWRELEGAPREAVNG